MTKTMEDWFLRGGERPSADTGNEGGGDPVCQNCGSCWPADVGETCPSCGAALTGGCPTDEYCGDDDDGNGELKTYIVTMSRAKSVQQTAEVRVKAHSEEEAMDLIEDRAERESERWRWEDNDDTEEFDDVEAVEAVEAEVAE